ncbi:MAG: hypothetical protein P8J17_13470 [Halioglobus sp.]|nr:hypothetical protein [Halioglobus sp.]
MGLLDKAFLSQGILSVTSDCREQATSHKGSCQDQRIDSAGNSHGDLGLAPVGIVEPASLNAIAQYPNYPNQRS